MNITKYTNSVVSIKHNRDVRRGGVYYAPSADGFYVVVGFSVEWVVNVEPIIHVLYEGVGCSFLLCKTLNEFLDYAPDALGNNSRVPRFCNVRAKKDKIGRAMLEYEVGNGVWCDVSLRTDTSVVLNILKSFSVEV